MMNNEEKIKILTERIEKLDGIIMHMPEGLFVVDSSLKIEMANDSALEVLGVADGSFSHIDDAHCPKLTECINNAFEQGTDTTNITINDRALQVIVNRIDSPKTTITCMLIDMTEKLLVERMKQEFTANVSHELKTPLTSISGYAEMIETGLAKSEDITKFASIIRKEAGRLLSLISDISMLSRLDESKLDNVKEAINLKDIAYECTDILTLFASKNNIKLNVIGENSEIYGNRNLIRELIYNLTDNAVRYNKIGGSVTIEVKDKMVVVKDTGIGIPREHHPHLFERFYRVDKSRSKQTGGTGLGLAIVKHIAEHHNASITLHSKENEGTEVTVFFE